MSATRREPPNCITADDRGATGRDVDLFHLETKVDLDASSVKIAEDGPLTASIVTTYYIGDGSHITAYLSLDCVAHLAKENALSALKFRCEVKWHEKHK